MTFTQMLGRCADLRDVANRHARSLGLAEYCPAKPTNTEEARQLLSDLQALHFDLASKAEQKSERERARKEAESERRVRHAHQKAAALQWIATLGIRINLDLPTWKLVKAVRQALENGHVPRDLDLAEMRRQVHGKGWWPEYFYGPP